jgi:hypothetical protein
MRLLLWITRVVLSLWVTAIFFHSPGVNGYYKADFPDMIYGRAYHPFVTRALFPWIVRCVVECTPSSVRHGIEENALTSRFLSTRYVAEDLQWRPQYLYEYLVAFFLIAACLVGFSIILERLWRVLYRPEDPYAVLVSTIGLLGLPPCFKYYSYLYDFPSLFLYSLCLYLLTRRSWIWYFFIFTLSCISKETAVLLIGVFALYFKACQRQEYRSYWSFLALQTLIWGIVRAAVMWAFRSNPGRSIELHLTDWNLKLLTTPYSIETAVVWLLFVTLVIDEYHSKPWLLRVAAVMLIPLLVLCLFFGLIDELRAYYEVYTAVVLLGSFSFLRLVGHRIETIAPTNASSVSRIRSAG